MKDLEEIRIATLVDSIEHQGIGGKQIRIEKEGTIAYILDTTFNNMTIGMYNFIMRRKDFMSLDEDVKIYYGHVGSLGYFVAEDEIKEWN